MNYRSLSALAVAALIAFVSSAAAEPITLKLSFFTSDRSEAYVTAVKPFVDAVNAAGKGSLQIQVYFSGALGKNQSETAQSVRDDRADIAFVVIGLQPPAMFHDTEILQMPGLFRDTREGTLAFTRLVAAKALKGYENFYVVGAYATEPETIHTHPPVAALKDLNGLSIGTNNPIEGAALAKLGMHPVVLPINEYADAIGGGRLDGVAKSVSIVFDFGITRVVTYHYMLGVSALPIALLMNRQKFDSLPKESQDIIRKYSGEWAAARFIDVENGHIGNAMERLKADPRRKFVIPSPADRATAQSAFNSIIAAWAEKSPHNRELLATVNSEIAKLRATR